MKFHFFQLMKSAPSSLLPAYLSVFEAAYPGNIVSWSQGKPSASASMPAGTYDEHSKGSLLFKSVKPEVQELFTNSSPEDVIVNTNISDLLLTKFPKQGPALLHLITQLPSPAQMKPLSRILAKRDDRFLFISETQKDLLADILPSQSTSAVIYPPNQLATVERRTEEQNTFIVGCVSPFEKNRGIETVIRALYAIREFLPQLRLVLVGEGSEKGQLQWLVSHLHLSKQIQFVSTGADYQRFIPHFDALVLPGEQAAAWNTDLIASWVHGVPVIATQNGIQKELIKNGQNGLLFEEGNAHMLSQHLLNLYNHPEWKEHYKSEGKRFVEQELSIQSAAKQLTGFFQHKDTPVAP